MDSIRVNLQDCVLQDFGSRLRQMDMASFGLRYKYYQRIEAGHVNPTLITMHRLASAFDVSVHNLFRPEVSTEA